jgi:hypothetical protein
MGMVVAKIWPNGSNLVQHEVTTAKNVGIARTDVARRGSNDSTCSCRLHHSEEYSRELASYHSRCAILQVHVFCLSACGKSNSLRQRHG